MEPSRFNELIAEFERYPVSDEDLNDFIEYLEADKRDRKKQRVEEAKEILRDCLLEIENTFGVTVYGEESRIYVDDLDFYIED